MKLIPYILYLLLLALHKVILQDLTTVYTVSISLSAFLVVAVALYKSETTAVWFGFFVGLVAGMSTPGLFGWYALLTALLGGAAFRVRERLNLDSLVSKLLLVFGGVLVYNIILMAISHPGGFFYLLGTSVVPGAVYTAIVAWVFFLFKEGRITTRKIKAMF